MILRPGSPSVWFSFLSVLCAVAGPVSSAFAQDSYAALGLCLNGQGHFENIERLTCESSAATLKAFHPGLEIPRCGGSAGPEIPASHLPVSALFVACGPDSFPSCLNVADEVTAARTGATVNILVTSAFLRQPEVAASMSVSMDRASKSSAKLNIIPIATSDPDLLAKYQRDPGMLSRGPNGAVYHAFPYSKNEDSAVAWDQVSEKCGFYRADRTYREMADFNLAYRSLFDRRAQKQAFAPKESEGATNGGNFVPLPGGTLAVGYSGEDRASQKVLNYFRKKQKVLEVEIPQLAVGHLDEVINVVPSREGNCGFAVLRASAREMKAALREARSGRILAQSEWRRASKEERSVSYRLRDEMDQLADRLTKASSEDQPALRSQLQALSRERDRLVGVTYRTLTAKEILEDAQLMAKWDEYERSSAQTAESVLNEIQRTSGCRPPVVDLPVFWSMEGEPVLANPVNGVAINQQYFYSKPHFKKWSEESWNEKYSVFRREGELISAPELQAFIEKRLKKVIPGAVHAVDTRQYDHPGWNGGGNMHCATTQIHLPCEP